MRKNGDRLNAGESGHQRQGSQPNQRGADGWRRIHSKWGHLKAMQAESRSSMDLTRFRTKW